MLLNILLLISRAANVKISLPDFVPSLKREKKYYAIPKITEYRPGKVAGHGSLPRKRENNPDA